MFYNINPKSITSSSTRNMPLVISLLKKYLNGN